MRPGDVDVYLRRRRGGAAGALCAERRGALPARPQLTRQELLDDTNEAVRIVTVRKWPERLNTDR
jgi:hypothetical protein